MSSQTSLSSSFNAVLIMDLVESVRIMEENPREAVQRWQAFVDCVRGEALPPYDGRLVESRGDSLVIVFPDGRNAVQAAFGIKRCCNAANDGMPPHKQFLLRTGVHVGEVFTSEQEVLGHTVNVAARLMTSVAGPGE